MNITEKIAYIKGLAEGLNLDESKPEVKLINAIVDLLDDIAYDLTDMEDLYDELSEQVDEIDQDLADVESEIYDEDYQDDADRYDDSDDFDDEETPFYEVTCDSCGEKINVSEDVLLEGEIECPNCGQLLEFDFSKLFSDDDFENCDLDCDDCKGCSAEETEEKEAEQDNTEDKK